MSPSILSIGKVKFAGAEYDASKYDTLTYPTAIETSREQFLASLESGKYNHVVAINRHLHDKHIGRFDASIIDALPSSVKVIANIGAGYDQIDVSAASRRHIYVTNTPLAVRSSTADTALFLLLGTLRNFAAGMRAVRDGEWISGVQPGRCPSSQTVGILGMGSIGRAIADRCGPLGAKLQYHNRRESPDAGPDIKYVSFDELLGTSDVIMVSVPLNAGTRHLLSTKEFGKMKKGVIIINTARGPIIDEEALVKALDDGIVGAVGLDVYENEPEVHPGLKGRDQCILLPHLGTHTTDASKLMEVQSLENITSVLDGGRLNIVPEQRDEKF